MAGGARVAELHHPAHCVHSGHLDTWTPPGTLPELRFTIRKPAPSPPGDHGWRFGSAVGNDVIRSRATPTGMSVTVSTGASLRAGDACSGVTTCWSSAPPSAENGAAGAAQNLVVVAVRARRGGVEDVPDVGELVEPHEPVDALVRGGDLEAASAGKAVGVADMAPLGLVVHSGFRWQPGSKPCPGAREPSTTPRRSAASAARSSASAASYGHRRRRATRVAGHPIRRRRHLRSPAGSSPGPANPAKAFNCPSRGRRRHRHWWDVDEHASAKQSPHDRCAETPAWCCDHKYRPQFRRIWLPLGAGVPTGAVVPILAALRQG